jgi:hypothetical protein
VWKFELLFFFHIYDLVNMYERRHKVLLALVLFMAIRHVMAVAAILQQLALHQLYGAKMMMFVVTPSLDSIEHKFNSKSINSLNFIKSQL